MSRATAAGIATGLVLAGALILWAELVWLR